MGGSDGTGARGFRPQQTEEVTVEVVVDHLLIEGVVQTTGLNPRPETIKVVWSEDLANDTYHVLEVLTEDDEKWYLLQQPHWAMYRAEGWPHPRNVLRAHVSSFISDTEARLSFLDDVKEDFEVLDRLPRGQVEWTEA